VLDEDRRDPGSRGKRGCTSEEAADREACIETDGVIVLLRRVDRSGELAVPTMCVVRAGGRDHL
jgi:hypothetical protein